MRSLSLITLYLWLTAGLIHLFRGTQLGVSGLIVGLATTMAFALSRRTRQGDRAAAALAAPAWLAFALHVRSRGVDFEGWIFFGATVAATAFVCWVTTRRDDPLAVEEPAREARIASRVAAGIYLPVAVIFGFLGFLHLHDAVLGISDPYAHRPQPSAAWPELGSEWRMHAIDNPGDLLPHGLDPADVNGDGHDDYVTHYEAGGGLRIAFHPGKGLRKGAPWPVRSVGSVEHAESSTLGDLDADRALDVIAVHGVEGSELEPGVRVFWGVSGPENPFASYAWTDGGDLPASRGGGHFLYVKTADVDEDGDLDIVTGGRTTRMAFGDRQTLAQGNGPSGSGLRWFENPGGAREQVRALERWRGHGIDARSRSGHGFELGDLDGDGDLDLVNANSDFGTPEAEEDVAWYENPGDASARTEDWPRHELLRSDEFYAKEQVAIADLDGDGHNDVLAHAPERIYWFRNLGTPGAGGPRFETHEIPKHPATRHRARPLEVADLDGDGELEIIGALIHRDGSLPRRHAAIFWMDRVGERWETHVIKWADGFFGLGFVNGEKWDQLLPRDVDGDGDLDLVASVEEYNRMESVLAVVWLENPRID